MPAVRIMPSRRLLLMALDEVGSQQVAARLFGISRDLMYEWCRQRRVTRDCYRGKRGQSLVDRLTADDVTLIRQLEDTMTASEVAAKFETSTRAVGRIWRKETWK
jgi:DNA invertase Pin-like site-specific DNA recombinase